MTRGILIGEIIDNLSNLNNQINFRCNLGFTDLNKVSEDFFAKLLNLIYGYKLINLNTTRSNEPGLDLGDISNSIAFQVTSQADSSKINSTLEKITAEQNDNFKIIKILIIGQKQGSYTSLNNELISKYQYTKKGRKEPESFISFNVVDIKDLLRDVISLDFKEIHQLYKFIKDEIQTITIELEIPQSDGNYPTSLLRKIEFCPETRAKNAKHILDDNRLSGLTLNEINELFNQLSLITRVTREIYFFVINRGDFEDNTFSIFVDEAIRILHISEDRLSQELKILHRRGLIFELDENDPKITLLIKNEQIGKMINLIKNNFNLTKLIISLDFTELDK